MTNKIHFKHHHGKAPDYAHWMYKKYSMDFMGQLYKDSKKVFIPTREKYITLIEYYENKLEKLNAKNSRTRS
jgi:hypothetical protein